MTSLLLILMGSIVGALLAFIVLRRFGARAPIEQVHTQTIFGPDA